MHEDVSFGMARPKMGKIPSVTEAARKIKGNIFPKRMPSMKVRKMPRY